MYARILIHHRWPRSQIQIDYLIKNDSLAGKDLHVTQAHQPDVGG